MLFNLAHSEDTSRSVRRATSRLLLFSRRAHCRFAIQVSTSNVEGHAVLHSIAWLSTESLLRNTRHSWQTWVTFLYSVPLRLPLISLDRTSADRLWHPRLQAPHFGEDLLQCVPIPSLRKILLSRHTHTHGLCRLDSRYFYLETTCLLQGAGSRSRAMLWCEQKICPCACLASCRPSSRACKPQNHPKGAPLKHLEFQEAGPDEPGKRRRGTGTRRSRRSCPEEEAVGAAKGRCMPLWVLRP